jgi:hypothetical protein
MLIERRTATGHFPADAPEAGIGHAAVVGAVIGYFVVLTIVSGIVLAAGAGLGVALPWALTQPCGAGPGGEE